MALTKAMKQLLAVLGSKRQSKTSSPLPPPQAALQSQNPVPLPVREKEPSSPDTKPAVPVPVNAPPKEVEERKELREGGKGGSAIESLPTELQIAILEAVTEVRSLDALLRASPGCWRAFHGGPRIKIFKALLQHALRPSLLLEARAVVDAKKVPRDGERLVSLRHFMTGYKESKARLASSENASGEVPLSGVEIADEDVIEMANRELLVQILTVHFCKDALRPVSASKRSAPIPRAHLEISETERHRIQRAMYRFEIFVALFAEKDFGKPCKGQGVGVQAMADLHFGGEGMKAWEAEELACVRDWIVRVYRRVLEETRELVWEMNVESEREELRCFMKEGKQLEAQAEKQVLARHQYWEPEQCEALMMMGLPFLAKVLKATSTREKFELLKPHLVHSFMYAPTSLTKALEADPDSGPPLAYIQVHHRRPRVQFDGDIEDGPNAAWVRSKRSERDAQGQWFESRGEVWREWGYCLWDEERLKGWGCGEWNWRNGERRERGRWVCEEVVRRSGRVLPKWVWVVDGDE